MSRLVAPAPQAHFCRFKGQLSASPEIRVLTLNGGTKFPVCDLKPEIGKQNHHAATSNSTAIAIVTVVVLLGASAFYFAILAGAGHSRTSISSPSSSTSDSTIQGIVAGIVTVGPSQPVCSQNQSCTEDLTGYSLVFSPQCGIPSTSCQKENFIASIAPSGHYSILLAPGNYTITGLSPSCNWVGCSSSFPEAAVVKGGQQLS